MTHNELLNALETNREFVLEMLKPKDFDLTDYISDPDDEDEVEKLTLQSIVWMLTGEWRVWSPTFAPSILENGSEPERVYVQSFEADVDDAHLKFERINSDEWRLTETRANETIVTERSFTELHNLLVDAFEADDYLFEDCPIDENPWMDKRDWREI